MNPITINLPEGTPAFAAPTVCASGDKTVVSSNKLRTCHLCIDIHLRLSLAHISPWSKNCLLRHYASPQSIGQSAALTAKYRLDHDSSRCRKVQSNPQVEPMSRFVPLRPSRVLFLAPLLLAGCAVSPASSSNSTSGPALSFAYATSNVADTISGYSVDPATGALASTAGMPTATGPNLTAIAHDPLGQFVVTNESPGIAVYAINQTTGALQSILPATATTQLAVRSFAFDPKGQFLYAAAPYPGYWDPPYPGATPPSPNPIYAFALNRATGVLTPISGSPFAIAAKAGGCCFAISPAGGYLYVLDGSNIDTFSLNATTGVPTLVSSVAGPASQGALTVDPSGAFVYVTEPNTNNSIYSYAISPSTGALSPGPVSQIAGASSSFLIVDPTGSFAYTAENAALYTADTTLGAYRIGAGKFTSLGSTSIGAMAVQAMQFGPSAPEIYLAEDNAYLGSVGSTSQIAAFAVNKSTGTLSPVSQAPLATGQWPTSLTITNAP
jgi:6-phosphogluconolactonase (cycloisomerase 2 family)